MKHIGLSYMALWSEMNDVCSKICQQGGQTVDVGSRNSDHLRNKQRQRGLFRKVHDRTQSCVFCTLNLCMNYITQTSQLVGTCSDKNEKKLLRSGPSIEVEVEVMSIVKFSP